MGFGVLVLGDLGWVLGDCWGRLCCSRSRSEGIGFLFKQGQDPTAQ